MSDIATIVNYFLANPGKYAPLLAILKGTRNGLVYGAKIRAPHAFVMTFLFRSGAFRDKIKLILRATYTHSRNLASFVFIYKSLCALMRYAQSQKLHWHSFVAAFIGGYIVFGTDNPINNQIVLYLFSRILVGLVKLGVQKGYISKPGFQTFPWFAAIVWGIVLWLFEYERSTLQESLKASMVYLYDDSNVWHNMTDFLFYNRLPRK